MQAIRVRNATPADAELFAGFNAAMALETEDKVLDPERLLSGVQGIFEEPGRGRYFVATGEADVPVGGCLVTYEWSDWRAGDFWWLQSVYVRPEMRGKGVFRALYDHIVALAKNTPGVCGLRLYVESENRRAQAVYEAVGMGESHYRLFEIDFVLG